MMNPKISIIFPTLNEAGCIADTLRSISRLSLPHETIVSDGRSTDATVGIARSFPGVTVVEHTAPGRQNISQGRNAGAKAAHGDYLAFMDADSRIADPDRFFAHAIARFEADPNLVGLTARLEVYPEDETAGDRIVFGILNMNLRFLNNVLHRGESTGEFQMIRRSVFEMLGGFREDLITREDADMFLRLSKAGRTMLDPKLTVLHSGRRAHAIGWPRLLGSWMTNMVWVMLFDKAKAKEWTVVR